MSYNWDFSVVTSNLDLIMVGLGNTLLLTLIALVFGTVSGLGVALVRISSVRWASWVATVFVEIFRATPPLVQLFWLYFALPRIFGVRLSGFEAAAIALSLVCCAFMSEVFRGGIASIPMGQWEASKALGMSRARTLRRIILPQAVRRMLPIFLERAIELLKTSTIASAVSFTDLLFAAQDISYRTYKTLEIFTVVAVIFFVIIFICSQLTHLVERRLARSGEFQAK